jgi:hypothetical protein
MSIIQEIKEEIRLAYKEPSGRDLTILALLFLIIPSAIGGLKLWWSGNESGYYWIGVGVSLGLLRLIPPLFRKVYGWWIALSIVLGYFISRLLLTLLYFLVVTPIGLVMRLVGKDPMERRIDRSAATYWIKRDQEEDYSIERYEKQF